MSFAYSTTCNGTLQTQTALDYYPYGKELRSYNSSAEKYKSTHNERDLETGYDYRNARSSSSDAVRFNSIDPLAAQYPSWSGYSYVMGNPVRVIDPTGLAGEGYDVYVDGDKVSNSAEKGFWSRQMGLYDDEQIAEIQRKRTVTVYGTDVNGTQVPILILKNGFIDKEIHTVVPGLTIDVVTHKIVPLVIDLSNITGPNLPDAIMASLGAGFAVGGNVSSSFQMVAILKGDDLGVFFYRPTFLDIGMGFELPNVGFSAGSIAFNWSLGAPLNRDVFKGYSTNVSISTPTGLSGTYVRSCTEGACKYFFGGTTLYSGVLWSGASWAPPKQGGGGGKIYVSDCTLIPTMSMPFNIPIPSK